MFCSILPAESSQPTHAVMRTSASELVHGVMTLDPSTEPQTLFNTTCLELMTEQERLSNYVNHVQSRMEEVYKDCVGCKQSIRAKYMTKFMKEIHIYIRDVWKCLYGENASNVEKGVATELAWKIRSALLES